MNKHILNIKDEVEEAVIEIYGEIGESWFGGGVTLQSVSEQLKAIATEGKKQVVVKINSLGGDVDSALAIYDLLRSMGDRVTTECSGMCASAATIIAMAGTRRRMSKYALFLIHKCWGVAVGNENELEAELETQRKVNDRLIQLYTDRTGAKREDIEELMERNNGDGSWLDIDEARAYGFITEEIPATDTLGMAAAYMAKRIKNMFNKKNTSMKKDITTLAALAGLLAVQELSASKEGYLLTEEQLEAINGKLELLDEVTTERDNLKADIETAQAELTEANTAKEKAEAKAAELQAIIDKIPAGRTDVNGNDTHEGDDYAAAWAKSDTYQRACAELGVEP